MGNASDRKKDRHSPGYMRNYMREYQRARRTGNDTERRFVGVDGEGGNLSNGYHAYFLLRAGDAVLRPRAGNVRLTSSECLAFIADLDPHPIYVGFFFDYDVTKILEDVPPHKLERLLDRSKRTRKDGEGIWPVDYGPYEFDYLPRKEFKVRRKAQGDKKASPWVCINDVGSFFQCRFVEALEKWGIGTDEEREIIGAGKEQRANFTVDDIETISPYNAMEIKLLQELMEKFRATCEKVGYLPGKWQGPGQLAEAAYSKHGVKRSKELAIFQDEAYAGLMTFARNAFYGGRPELSAIGPVDVPVYQWDINSAYPRAMLDVPCLEHGMWENVRFSSPVTPDKVFGKTPYRRALKTEYRLALFYGSFTSSASTRTQKRPMWMGLPVRNKDGGICYPANGRGWYWSFEVDAAIHQSFRVEEAWIYDKTCSCEPLGFVHNLYQQRLSLGKDDAGIVLKLLLNSLYGKTVQSIGSPKYANPIWGSFITAFCRTMIQRFIHSSPFCEQGECGKDVLMVATDSVATITRRDDMEPSKDLGEWSMEEHPRGMFLIQPGLYFGTSGKAVKTRGVPRSVIETMEPVFREAFDRMVRTRKLEEGDVSVPQRMFVGIKYALHRKNTKLLGQWVEFTDEETGSTGKTIRFDWTSKRAAYPVLNPIPGVRSYLETYPPEGSPANETIPYSKDIGGIQNRENLRMMYEGQPDWTPQIEPVHK